MFENENKESRIAKAFSHLLLQRCSHALTSTNGQDLIIGLLILENICRCSYVAKLTESNGIMKTLTERVSIFCIFRSLKYHESFDRPTMYANFGNR